MRILLVTNLFPPDVLGGYELLASDIANALRSRGNEVVVLTTGRQREDDPSWVERGLSLIRPFEEPGQLDRLRHIQAAGGQRAIAEETLDRKGPFDAVLFASQRRLGLHVARAVAARGIPAVWLFNDDWLLAHAPAKDSRAPRQVIRRLFERGPLGAQTWRGVSFERAIYVSAAIRTALIDGGAPLPSGIVCFQGVDRKVFAPRPFRALPADPTLMFAGRLHPTKGCEVAIEALAKLVGEGVEAKLVVAGRGAPDYEASLRALSAKCGVESRIEWLGFVDRARLPEVYARADAFVFPSLWEEPAGLTYLEAMSVHVPVVAIARGGAKELFVDGENAIVADDAEGIARGVRALVASPSLARRIVLGGDALVEREATLGRYVDVIENELRVAGTRAA